MEAEKKYKLLIVDDSSFNRLIMTSMLARNYFLEEACDGKQAMLILQDRAEEFSLVLLDIVMPNMDGFEVLRAMKERGWLDFLPVIMISSDYTPENIEMSYQLGASDLIRRPYDEKVVCHRIANTIALSSRHRALSNALVDEIIRENENNEAMISILSHIVETRNGESGAHVQNIRRITGMLLKKLTATTDLYPLSAEKQLQIITASSLHDIGKMSVPEEILNKPGKLTDEEFKIIKGHSMMGANMVEPLLHKKNANPLLQMAYDICRWHHERYDGRGYPDGLKGEEIPIAAQVVSVADVYDALTSERCYKPAYTPEQAVQMIRGGQCGIFNPLLVDCLVAILDNLKSLSDASDGAAEEVVLDHLDVTSIVASSNKTGMFSSGKITEALKHERLRSRFFFLQSDLPMFYYTAFSSTLHLNKASMELFKLDKSVITLDDIAVSSYGSYAVGMLKRARERLARTTPKDQMIKDDFLLTLPGEEPRNYQCVMQIVWDPDDAETYSEVLGELISLEDRAGSVLPAEKIKELLPAAGNSITGMGAWYLINALKFMVYNVRLIDPSDSSVVELDSSGKITKSQHRCFDIWKQSKKCLNCTSAKCLTWQKEFAKIMFFENEIFYIVSQYIKIDGVPLVLEMLTRITDNALVDQNGKKLSSRSISDLNRKLHLDSLTNLYNRRYYNEKANEGEALGALAVANVDDFKRINETYGRTIGDYVLVCVARAIGGEISAPDALVRYDADEFVMMFKSIDPDAFEEKLQRVRDRVSSLAITGLEEGQRVEISIGGAVGPALPSELLTQADEMLRKAKKERSSIEIRR